jgi:hypothetical protein
MDIFCGNCGAKNNSSYQFCENCGHRLSSIQVPGPYKGRTWSSKIASIGAAIVLIFFFLPWASVSCSSSMLSMSSLSVSGYQIASGNIPALKSLNDWGGYLGALGGMDTSGTSDLVKNALNNKTSSPAVWLIFVVGLVGLLSLLGGRSGGRIALGVGILGVIGLIIFGINLSGINSQINTFGFRAKTEFGLIAEWLGFLFMIGMGILSLLYDNQKEKSNPQWRI